VDSTYYGTPAEHVVRGWAERVPSGFVFALKLPQELTPAAAPSTDPSPEQLALFCDRVKLLGPKLGPVLVQLGPDYGPERWDAVERFLEGLPRDIGWAIEFRDRAWVGPRLHELLRRRGVALALVEGRSLPRDRVIELAIHPTADFGYVRWMGTGGGKRIEDFSRVQVDRERELSVWAMALAALAARVERAYGYFGNQFQGHAPASARAMQRLIGQKPVEPEQLGAQTTLF